MSDPNKVYACIGASNHSNTERELNDYYATTPYAIDLLLSVEAFNHSIWECACGGGHMAERLKQYGYDVFATDIVDRGFPQTVIADFLKQTDFNKRDIITNPPYKYAQQFVEHALEISATGTKVAMFLKLTFLEGKSRKEMFRKYPPKVLYVSSSRLHCAKNGDFETFGNSGTAVAYGWFVWEKGYAGEPVIRWIN